MAVIYLQIEVDHLPEVKVWLCTRSLSSLVIPTESTAMSSRGNSNVTQNPQIKVGHSAEVRFLVVYQVLEFTFYIYGK